MTIGGGRTVKKELSRREVLKVTGLAAAIGPIGATSGAREEARISVTPSGAAARPSQGSYRATVPDTLDLAARAELAINGLAGTLDWEHVPEFYFRVTLAPPTMVHDALSFCACGPSTSNRSP
jgi:hypothetical protein